MPTLSSVIDRGGSRARVAGEIVLGPWPIRPLFVFLLAFGAINFGLNLEVWLSVAGSTFRFSWLELSPQALGLSIIVVSPVVAVELLRTRILRRSLTRTWYLSAVAVTSVMSAAFLLEVLALFTQSGVDVRSVGTLAVRLMIVQIVLYAALGVSQRRLNREVSRANAAVAQLVDQQELMVRTEEASRRSVADFLHDRVQSILVTSAMQLRQIAERTDVQAGAELRSVAEYLDDLRAVEVREANTRLSPNIAVVGLENSIRQLLESMAPDLEVDVSLDNSLLEWATPSSPEDLVPIGVFRIIEQAAANAVIHGHANCVSVRIEREGAQVALRILDNGSGLTANLVPGSGTAVIESWVGILRGTWTRQNLPERGVEVLVRVPLERP